MITFTSDGRSSSPPSPPAALVPPSFCPTLPPRLNEPALPALPLALLPALPPLEFAPPLSLPPGATSSLVLSLSEQPKPKLATAASASNPRRCITRHCYEPNAACKQRRSLVNVRYSYAVE